MSDRIEGLREAIKLAIEPWARHPQTEAEAAANAALDWLIAEAEREALSETGDGFINRGEKFLDNKAAVIPALACRWLRTIRTATDEGEVG